MDPYSSSGWAISSKNNKATFSIYPVALATVSVVRFISMLDSAHIWTGGPSGAETTPHLYLSLCAVPTKASTNKEKAWWKNRNPPPISRCETQSCLVPSPQHQQAVFADRLGEPMLQGRVTENSSSSFPEITRLTSRGQQRTSNDWLY